MGLSKAYLFAYNLTQFCGWAYLMYRLLPHLLLQIKSTQFIPARNPTSVYEELGDYIKLIQTAAILEIVHAILGLVRSSPMVTAMQTFGRLGCIWLPINYIPQSQTSPGLTIVLFAWCLVEIVRYPFYAFNLINIKVEILTWLRYSLFIILYPIGALGEMWCYFDALPFLATSKALRIEMPNAYNFTFSPYMVTIMILLAYFPLMPPMYFHMLVQRKKVFGDGNSEEKSKKVV